MRVLTYNPYANGSPDTKGGPSVFMDKLIQSATRQGLAEFCYGRADRIDVILAVITQPDIGIVRRCKSLKIPTILRLDGIVNEPKKYTKIQDMYNASNHIIYQSLFAKELVQSYFGNSKPYTIILNGDDYVRFDKATKKLLNLEGFTFLCLGKWRDWKRLDIAVKSVASLIDDGHNVNLIIGGDTDITVAEKYASRIHKIGHIKQSMIPRFFNSGSAFVHPARCDVCPNVVVEATMAKKPSILHHTGGSHEISGKAGVICQSYDLHEWKSKMLYTIEHAGELSAAAALRRQELHIDVIAKHYIDTLIAVKKTMK